MILLGKLLEQQELEQEALTSQVALEALSQGSLAHEILQAMEIETEL